MKRVISALHFEWRDMEDCLGIALESLGLDGVELSWHDSFARPHCTHDDFAALARRPRPDAALSAHVWDNLAETEHHEVAASLLRWLEHSRRTGVTNLVIHGGSYPDQREGIGRARRVLESVSPAFERAQVTLNLENHYAYEYRGFNELFSEPWEFYEALSLDSPALKFCFDTGHGAMTRNSVELLDALAPYLNYVHLADNYGVNDDHLAFGQGTVAWDAIFAKLTALAFDGVMCVEFPVRDDRAPFDACMQRLRQSLER